MVSISHIPQKTHCRRQTRVTVISFSILSLSMWPMSVAYMQLPKLSTHVNIDFKVLRTAILRLPYTWLGSRDLVCTGQLHEGNVHLHCKYGWEV